MKTSSAETHPRLRQACAWDGASLIPEEPVTFSGDLHGDASCRGPEIESGVARAQSQPGAAGVPLKATHSGCLLQHGLQAHLLRVPNPDDTGHVVYSQKIDAAVSLERHKFLNCSISFSCLTEFCWVYDIKKNPSTIFSG